VISCSISRLKQKEDVAVGLENALARPFSGRNFGKQLPKSPIRGPSG
jgi:hypothetical protein